MTTEHTDLSRYYPNSELCSGYVDVSDRSARPTLLWETTFPELLASRHQLYLRHGVNGHRGTLAVDLKWQRKWTDLRNDAVLMRGDAQIARRIDDALAIVECPPSAQRTWGMAPAGAYPIVPVALGGDPCSMRYRTTEASHSAPLRVFYPLVCSSKVKAEQFADTLAALMAGLRMLADRRPVELIGYGGTGFTSRNSWRGSRTDGQHDAGCFTAFPIPIDFGDSRGAAMFADASIGRTILIAMHNAMGRTKIGAPWPWDRSPIDEVGIRHTKMALGLQDDDVLIPPLFGRDGIDAARQAMVDAAAMSGVELTLPGAEEPQHHLIPY